MNREPFMQRSAPDMIGPDGKPWTPRAFRHQCMHPGCTREGSFGFGVRLLHGKPGTWYCYEHKNDGEKK